MRMQYHSFCLRHDSFKNKPVKLAGCWWSPRLPPKRGETKQESSEGEEEQFVSFVNMCKMSFRLFDVAFVHFIVV
jgi:hypothetical protein